MDHHRDAGEDLVWLRQFHLDGNPGIRTSLPSVVIAVTYHDLRVAKEGIDIEQTAAVFD